MGGHWRALARGAPQQLRAVVEFQQCLDKPGGRFAVSDVIADPTWTTPPAPDMPAYTGCIAGAVRPWAEAHQYDDV